MSQTTTSNTAEFPNPEQVEERMKVLSAMFCVCKQLIEKDAKRSASQTKRDMKIAKKAAKKKIKDAKKRFKRLPKEERRDDEKVANFKAELSSIQQSYTLEVCALDRDLFNKLLVPLADKFVAMIQGTVSVPDYGACWKCGKKSGCSKMHKEVLRWIVTSQLKLEEAYTREHLTKFGSEWPLPSGGLLPWFWASALLPVAPFFGHPITTTDRPALAYLTGIRKRYYPHGATCSSLEFSFAANPFFDNAVLTRTYWNKVDHDPTDTAPRTTGTKILWKDNMDLTKTAGGSFFNFFSPPVPETTTDEALKKDDETSVLIEIISYVAPLFSTINAVSPVGLKLNLVDKIFKKLMNGIVKYLVKQVKTALSKERE